MKCEAYVETEIRRRKHNESEARRCMRMLGAGERGCYALGQVCHRKKDKGVGVGVDVRAELVPRLTSVTCSR